MPQAARLSPRPQHQLHHLTTSGARQPSESLPLEVDLLRSWGSPASRRGKHCHTAVRRVPSFSDTGWVRLLPAELDHSRKADRSASRVFSN